MIERPTLSASRRIAMMALLALLAGCGNADDEARAPGGLTADDARQLNEAAEMLDAGNHPPAPGNSLAQ